jgi:carotenoid cleavage dioxygenase
MMHDFGVTRDYAVFHVVPSIGSWERLEQGLPHFGFDTTKDVYLGILPRDGEGKDVRWFKTPNCFASHVMNAHNVGSKIHFDVPEAKNNMFPFFPDVHGKPFNMEQAHSRLTRWTVDMESNSDGFESKTTLCDLFGEFPRIDDRYAMAPYRHGYMLVMDVTKPFDAPGGRTNAGLIMNTLAHYDHATGKAETWHCGPTSTLQEPCFIPKSPKAPEGEGYIVQVCNRLDERRSDLLVFDAQRIAQGPIGVAKLPLRLRFGLHGNWIPATALKGH